LRDSEVVLPPATKDSIMPTIARTKPPGYSPPAPIAGAGQGLQVIIIACSAPAGCLEAVLRSVTRLGVPIQTFSIKPSGRQFEAVLRLAEVSDGAAERLASMIAAWPGIGSVRLEHQWLRS